MPLITDKIMEQMRSIGEPRVTTQESTVTAPQEGLDMGSMGLILAMLLGMNPQAGGAGLPGVGQIATGPPPVTGFAGPTVGSAGLPGLGSLGGGSGTPQINPQALQLLMSIISGSGAGGL